MRVLVTGAGGSAAANFVDALRRSSLPDLSIVGADARPTHLALCRVDARRVIPPVSDPAYLDALNQLIADEDIDLLHPQPDVEVAFLAEHRTAVDAPVWLPSPAAVALCQDKMAFNLRMQEAGVPVPQAIHLQDIDQLASALSQLLVKQPRVWLRAIRGAGSRASLPVSNALQAEGWIDYWRDFRGLQPSDFMLSELLPGAEFAWQSLWRDGELITSQARERLEYVFGNLTPSGQTSSPSVARTVNRADVNQIGRAAVLAADPRADGVFCVDMKEDGEGTPRVTEINAGRFFTTSNFFAHAGLNMPEMYVRLALDPDVRFDVPRVDPLPAGLLWVRMIDMGYALLESDG